MANAAKTIIGTGTSSGLGFELIRQLLLDHPHPYHLVLGVRDPAKSRSAFDALKYDTAKHDVSLLKVDFADLRQVRDFARQALEKVGGDKLDYVLLNHAVNKGAEVRGANGSTWCEAQVVNHESHHYLMHLLQDKITFSHSRVVFVSSGAVCMVKDTASLRPDLLSGAKADGMTVYCASKFTQLLGAHYWRRTLGDKATVVAVSPGLIPGTGLGRHIDVNLIKINMAGAKSLSEGARSMLAAFERSDFPEDPNAIFLTSWGEWWNPNEQFPLTLDKGLQDQWCVSQAEIEKGAGL